MAQSRRKAFLKIVQGGQVVESVELGGGMLIIGREESDLVLEDVEVSTSHCQVQVIGGEYHVFDLNSTNGTFVNGQRIAKSKLTSGDRIRIGRTEFHFFLESAEEAPAVPLVQLNWESVAAPESPLGREVEDLLLRERTRFLERCHIVVDVTYFDGQKDTLVVPHELVVGRSSSTGKFSSDEELSRKHARIFVGDDGSPWVEDLGSTNGVAVNGAKIGKPVRLTPEDLVRVGRTRIKVQVRSGTEYSF